MGAGVQRWSPFLLVKAKEEEPGREGLESLRSYGERRAVRPIPALLEKSPMTESFVGGASAAPLSMRATAVVASAVVRAARQLFTDLERSRRIDAAALRNAMDAAFGASDASGA